MSPIHSKGIWEFHHHIRNYFVNRFWRSPTSTQSVLQILYRMSYFVIRFWLPPISTHSPFYILHSINRFVKRFWILSQPIQSLFKDFVIDIFVIRFEHHSYLFIGCNFFWIGFSYLERFCLFIQTFSKHQNLDYGMHVLWIHFEYSVNLFKV